MMIEIVPIDLDRLAVYMGRDPQYYRLLLELNHSQTDDLIEPEQEFFSFLLQTMDDHLLK